MNSKPTHIGQGAPPYRADIDGLRAIAVLAVVAFHAFPKHIPGGYIGVDIFFIISGFLISGIILGNLSKNKFSLADFYSRRIRRIFPALLIVIMACLAFGWLFLLPDEYAQLGKHAAGGIGFIANFLLLSEVGYFDVESDLKPFLHLWSLSIEEQFYLFWPLLLWWIFRWRRHIFLLTIVIIAFSFCMNIFSVRSDQSLAFYSPLSRIWELLIGALLAILQKPDFVPARVMALWNVIQKQRFHHFTSLAGIILIALPIFILNKGSLFPGIWALAPTLGAFLIIMSDREAWFNKWILSSRALVSIGLISYPLYLWHWPVLSMLHIGSPTADISTQSRFLAIGLSLVLSCLTYWFLEKPFRFAIKPRLSIPILTFAALLLFSAGLWIYQTAGFPSRVDDSLKKLSAHYSSDEQFRRGRCHLDANQSYQDFAEECFEPAAGKKRVWLYGDSHAGQFYLALKNLQTEFNFSLSQTTLSGCPPWRENTKKVAHCGENNRWMLERLKADPPDVLIVGSADFKDSNYKENLAWLQAKLEGIGVKKIIVLGRSPRWSAPLAQLLLAGQTESHSFFDRLNRSIPERSQTGLDRTVAVVDRQMQSYIQENQLPFEYYSISQLVCSEEGCLTLHPESGNVMAYDKWHFTVDGSDFVIRPLMASLLNEK